MFLSGLINGRRGTSDPLQHAEFQEGLGSPPIEQFLPRRGPQAGGWGDAARAAARRAQAAAAEERRFEEGRRFKGINGYGYLPSGGQELEFARALFAESGGSPLEMAAHASAMLNRVRPSGRPGANRFGNRPTLSEVLRVRGQFSFQPNQSGNGPNGSPQYELSGHPERMRGTALKSWAMAQEIARRALAGKLFDQTDGATTYFASSTYDGSPDSAPGISMPRVLRGGSLRVSPYRSPYPQRPENGRAPRPTFFFRHRDDLPDKP